MKIPRLATRAGLIALLAMALRGGVDSLLAGDESVKARRETVRLTAKLLVEELGKNIENAPIDENALRGAMSISPAEHVERRKSKELLRGQLRRRFRENYQREVKRVIDRLNTETPENIESWFSDEDANHFSKIPEEAIKKNLDDKFLKTFKRVRDQACRQQFVDITNELYPNVQDVETANSDKLKLRMKETLEKAKASRILFEEVAEKLNETFVEEIIADAEAQKHSQLAIVEKSESNDSLLPSFIINDIEKRLGLAREDLERREISFGAPDKVYDTFPSVRKATKIKATSLAKQSFINSLEKMNFSIDEERVRRLIVSDYPAHRERRASLDVCYETYSEPIISHAIKVAARPLNGRQRAEGVDFMTNLALTDDACQRALKRMALRSLKGSFDVVRKEIRNDQLKEYFEPLADGSWEPETARIESFHRVAGNVHVDEPLREKSISNLPLTPNVLLDETRELVSEKVDYYMNEGRRALTAQLKITDDVEKNIERTLPDQLAHKPQTNNGVFQRLLAFVNLADDAPQTNSKEFDAVVKTFTSEVKKQWERQRVILLWKEIDNLPVNRDTKYAELFPMVHQEIEKRVKAMLHREQDPETTTAEINAGDGEKEGGGGGAATHSAPRTTTKQVAVDLIIDVDVDGERLVVDFLRGDQPTETKTLPMAAFARRSSSVELDGLLPELTTKWLRDQDRRGEHVRCSVFVRVFHEGVPYGVIAGLRDHFKKRLESIKPDNVSIQWFEKYYRSSFKKGTRNVPDSYRSRGLQFPISPGMELTE